MYNMHKYHNYIFTFVKKKNVLTHFDVYWNIILLGPRINTENPGSTKLPLL